MGAIVLMSREFRGYAGPMSAWPRSFAALVMVLAGGACAGGPAPCAAVLPTTTITLVAADGTGSDHRLTVELAETDADRARGLSGRASLGDRCGMLFRYPEPVRNGFWMRDMGFPLDIAFADAGGTIVDVVTLQPCEAACPRYEPATAYTVVLEVGAGALDAMGIGVGDRLIVDLR